MTTPDDHLAVLRQLARDQESIALMFRRRSGDGHSVLAEQASKRAAALRWLLEETAYGVDPSEVVV